jgi:hypothetical protein
MSARPSGGPRSDPGAVVGRRIRLFLDAGVDPGQLVEQAARDEAADEKVGGDDPDDDVRRLAEVRKLDQRAERDRDDDSNDPVFRSDIPGHSPFPFC